MKVMKLLLLTGIFFFVLFSASYNAIAQGIYMKFGSGYNFALNNEVPSYEFNFVSLYGTEVKGGSNTLRNYSIDEDFQPTDDPTTEIIRSSYGKSVNIRLGGGYMFNPYIGAEANIDYAAGIGIDMTADVPFLGNQPVEYTEHLNTHANVISVIPAAVVTPGLEGIFNPYARAGFIIAVPRVITSFRAISASFAIQNEADPLIGKLKGGAALGFEGALGFTLKINSNLKIFTEATAAYLEYTPKKWIIEKYINPNSDNEALTALIGEFEQSLVKGADELSDVQKPAFTLPFSRIGIDVGLMVNLGSDNRPKGRF